MNVASGMDEGAPAIAGSSEGSADTDAFSSGERLSALLFMLEDLERGRKQIEQAHHEWIASMDAIRDPIFMHDKNYRIMRSNRAYAERAGMPVKEVIGKLYWEVFPKLDGPLPNCCKALQQAEEEEEEEEIQIESGAVFVSRSFSVRNGDGSYLYSLHVMEDITERKRAEGELQLRAQLLDSVSDTIFVLDLDGNFVYLNEAAWKSRGYTRDEMMGMNLHTLDTPEYEKTIEARFREITEKGQCIFESAHRRKDGSVMPVEVNARVIELGGRKLLLSVIRDITERKRAEEALSASEEQYRSLVNNIPDVVWTIDKDGNTAFISPNIRKAYGYSPDEICADPSLWFGNIHSEDRKNVEDAFGELFTGKRVFDIEYRVRRKDGEWIWLHDRALAAYEKEGKWYADGVFTDITDRKQAEEALAKSEEKYRLLIDNLQEGVWMIDKDGNTSFANPRMAQMLGYTVEEMLGRHLFSFMDERGKETASRNLDRRMQVIKERHDFEFLRKDGIRIYAALETSPILDEAGNYAGVLAGVMDITERRQMEIALRSSNHAFKTLSECNHELVHATDEAQLLQAMCRVVVESGGYRAVWVGRVQHDAEKSVRPMAQSGFAEGYLGTLQITWADSEYGRGPTGRAIRSGTAQFAHDIRTDPDYAPWCEQALKHGYASSIALPLLEGCEVFGVLNIYAAEAEAFDQEEIKLLQEMADDLAFGIRMLRLRQEQQRAAEQVRMGLVGTVQAIAAMVEMRDPYTAGHQRRVAQLAAAIAVEMGLPEEQVRGIHLAGTIHDLGKIQTPAEILSKPGKLSATEFGLIKDHPQNGYETLKDIEFPWPIAQMVLQHHERLDGSGYPQGLKGDEILPEARILAVADTVEAMSSHRPYRPGLGLDAALAEITRQRGIHYDAQVVDACRILFCEKHYSFG